MQYLDRNYRSKAAVRRALADGEKIRVRIVEPQETTHAGLTTVAGPWFPEPHRWYWNVALDDDGYVTRIW